MSKGTATDPGLLACEEQVVTVQDGLARLADRYLWEEIDRLLQIYVVARRGASFAAEGARCEAATREALGEVAQRWARQGVETAGAQSHDLARRAFRALREHFPAAADAPKLRHAMGRIEWVRAEKLSLEIGERTLVDEGYRAAHEHHKVALAGGLPPELAALSGREQLEAIRRAHDRDPGVWDMSKETCVPDARGRCAQPLPRVAPTELSASDAEWLAAYDAFLAVPALNAAPEGIAVATARAELLMRYRRWDAAEPALRAVVGPGQADAQRLLLGLLVARWMEAVATAERTAARRALIAAAAEVSGGEVGALAASLRRSALWAEALETEAARDHAGCGAAFEGLYGELGGDREAAAEAAEGAGRCFARAGAIQNAITWLARLADEHRDAVKPSLDATFDLAQLHEQILDDEPARARYLDFVARAPRGDRRVPNARRRSIALGLRSGTLPEEQVAALVRGRTQERSLAAAIRFRAAARAGAPAAEIERYIDGFGKDGGPRRLAIAHVRAAEALLRASCPVDAAEGLCAQVGRDRTPARVVSRDPKLLARAREHLDRAQALLPDALAGGAEAQEPLLSVAPEEVRAASRRVALLLGDLDAESALSTRPPASLDPSRSRAWLDVRRAEVERMSAVYERAVPQRAGGRDAAIALVETRKAQVYESDLALLEEVAAAVEAAGDAALAVQMRELAAVRREAVFVGYARCLDAVAEWGHDGAGQASLCRAGLGRLVGRYEEPIEYVPDADGRFGAPPRATR